MKQVKVVDSLAKAVEIMDTEYNVETFISAGVIYTGEQLVEKFAGMVRGSIRVSGNVIHDEGEFYTGPLTGEVNRCLMDAICFPISDNEKHEMIYRALRELASLLAVYNDYGALGNEWVRKWLPECSEYFGEGAISVQNKAMTEIQNSLFCNCRQAVFDWDKREVAVAEFDTSYLDSEGVNRGVSIRCVYGEWFGLVDGASYLPINVDCLKKLLNGFVKFSVCQEIAENHRNLIVR